MTEAGRRAWYDAEGRPIDAYIVGIAGGSASGKTSVARAVIKSLPNVPWVAIVSQDSFVSCRSASRADVDCG
jgi:uridine kinase